MIFLNHRCYCHLGFPRIVSAKYEVVLSLATVVFLSDKSYREEREEERKNSNNFKEVSMLSHENLIIKIMLSFYVHLLVHVNTFLIPKWAIRSL